MADKDSFILHKKLLDIAFKQLKTDAQLGQLLRAIYLHNKGESYQIEDPFVSVVFDFFANQLSIDKEKYEDICKKRKDAINKRWGKQESAVVNSDTTDTKNTNVSYNDNDNDNDNDNVNDVSTETDIKENNISKESAPPPSPLHDATIGQIVQINGKQAVKRANNRVFIIPTLAEVEDWVAAKGYHFSPQLFIDHYSNSSPHPWCKSDGSEVKNWKQCCATFESTVLRSEGRRRLRQQSTTTEAHADINTRQYEQF